jgi:hypothetical protein
MKPRKVPSVNAWRTPTASCPSHVLENDLASVNRFVERNLLWHMADERKNLPARLLCHGEIGLPRHPAVHLDEVHASLLQHLDHGSTVSGGIHAQKVCLVRTGRRVGNTRSF